MIQCTFKFKVKKVVSKYLNDPVDDFQTDDWLGHEKQRTKRVEKRLEQNPDDLGEGVAKQDTFHGRRNVHVNAVHT